MLEKDLDFEDTTFVLIKPRRSFASSLDKLGTLLRMTENEASQDDREGEQVPTLLWIEDEKRFQVAHAGAGGREADGKLRVAQQVYLSYGLIYQLYENHDVTMAALLLDHETRHARERLHGKVMSQPIAPETESAEVRAILQTLWPYIQADVAVKRSVENTLSRPAAPIPLLPSTLRDSAAQ